MVRTWGTHDVLLRHREASAEHGRVTAANFQQWCRSLLLKKGIGDTGYLLVAVRLEIMQREPEVREDRKPLLSF